jgi:hypothetical protein
MTGRVCCICKRRDTELPKFTSVNNKHPWTKSREIKGAWNCHRCYLKSWERAHPDLVAIYRARTRMKKGVMARGKKQKGKRWPYYAGKKTKMFWGSDKKKNKGKKQQLQQQQQRKENVTISESVRSITRRRNKQKKLS